MRRSSQGFSLIEILLVLTIIGILSAIAIPAYWGAKSNARYTGDAKANAATIMQAMSDFASDNGGYYPDPAGGPYKWLKGVPPAASPLPRVTFVNGTQLDFTLVIGANRLTYTLEATDPANGNKQIYKVDQNGAIVP